ncbi:uncharacterized protein LOC116940056 isoform X2 [Petromyzon marinus]|uniref:Tumor protein p53-inducible protein 11 n=1 Tax=Petromyzon marinus TaxID=7757 RepID=A0AAJ7SUW2_PETMA|nr:uncharacterized protein LOC116940056 isoform X2 [Petromyzon marinus]
MKFQKNERKSMRDAASVPAAIAAENSHDAGSEATPGWSRHQRGVELLGSKCSSQGDYSGSCPCAAAVCNRTTFLARTQGSPHVHSVGAGGGARGAARCWMRRRCGPDRTRQSPWGAVMETESHRERGSCPAWLGVKHSPTPRGDVDSRGQCSKPHRCTVLLCSPWSMPRTFATGRSVGTAFSRELRWPHGCAGRPCGHSLLQGEPGPRDSRLASRNSRTLGPRAGDEAAGDATRLYPARARSGDAGSERLAAPMATKTHGPLLKKHSQTDLLSRLKTRKILGVGGEDDDGEIHRSKVRRVQQLGDNGAHCAPPLQSSHAASGCNRDRNRSHWHNIATGNEPWCGGERTAL